MKIHSDTITREDISQACVTARAFLDDPARAVYAYDVANAGSRSRRYGWNVYLTGNAPHRSQHDRAVFAATYDEWGFFLAALYEVDPEMIAGPYKTGMGGNPYSDFYAITDGKYSDALANARDSERV